MPVTTGACPCRLKSDVLSVSFSRIGFAAEPEAEGEPVERSRGP
jgi:hypothetical protein